MISRCKHEPAGRGWRRDLMAVSVIALAGAGCAPEAPPAISSFEDTVAVQARLNEYFHAQVLPRLQPCWQRLEGSGTVAIAHSYVRDRGAVWTPDETQVEEATLAPAEAEAAARCMREAVAGTSFPVEPREDDESRFVVHWVWPVPLPEERPAVGALYFGPGGGLGGGLDDGCDGEGAPPRCKACVEEPSGGYTCALVCVGFEMCQAPPLDGPEGIVCDETTACASGGLFDSIGVLAPQ